MNKDLRMGILSEMVKLSLNEEGPYVNVELPDYVEKELADKGLNLQNLYKKDFPRKSLSPETKHWIMMDLLPTLKSAPSDTEEVSENHNYSQQGTSMSKGELRDGIKNAIELYRLLQSGQELPPWAAAYVTLSSDYLHSVNEYMVEKSTQSMYQEGVKSGVTAKEIADMREWIADVQWEDLGEEDVKDLSDEEVIRGVDKNYEGGLKAFRRDISQPPTKK